MLDWLVIGGGPHGVHAAARLIGEAGVCPDRVRILDDEDQLLARWRRCARNTGMRYLRSPAVHHLDLSSSSLQHFVKAKKGSRFPRPFTRPYSRPSLEVFDRHSDEVIARFGLEALHVRGRATSLAITEDSVRVGVMAAPDAENPPEIEARQVILALGAPSEPAWPSWARDLREKAGESGTPPPIDHIFDPGFQLDEEFEGEEVAVVGAGISGVQVAVRLARAGRRVVLLSRHARSASTNSTAIRVGRGRSTWPASPGSRTRTSDAVASRRRVIGAQSRPTSIRRCGVRWPTEASSTWRRSRSTGRWPWEAVSRSLDGREITVDRVLLATGFPSDRPGGAWLDRAIEAHALPCAECGFPIVDRGLRWHPRVLVTGALAELEIGPVSRNLSGAMRAGERIAAVARTDTIF